jgi:transcriptional regulator with XRE-family HTH domain
MKVSSIIQARLKELGFDQKGLAAAAEVTESYISQLLTGKKLPPAPDRTDIYQKMDQFLQFPNDELANLARAERMEHLKRGLEGAPAPLLKDVRDLILRKCTARKLNEIRAIFERQPLGELERFVTQRLLDVVSRVARTELDNEKWLRDVAQLSGKSYAQMRVVILQFLDTNIFNVSNENCVSFLDPLIAAWDIDLETFSMEILLNQRLVPGHPKKFAFVQTEPDELDDDEPGLVEFLRDSSLSGDISTDEVKFLRRLRFNGKRPQPLYLRDPLHFRNAPR